MRFLKTVFLILVASPLTLSFPANGQQNSSVGSRTALPIVITNGISASTAHVGDVIYAKTTQLSQLPNGTSVPSGTKVVGHVIATSSPVERNVRASSDVVPASTLTVRFEAIELSHERVPINAYVRAMADPIESDGARMPLASDIDPQGTTTQIGGDLFTPSQTNVTDADGQVVGRNLRHGVYARLRNNGDCAESASEVSVGIYSGSACGLYGFTEVSATGIGSHLSRDLTFRSTDTTSRIWKRSTALLELDPNNNSLPD